MQDVAFFKRLNKMIVENIQKEQNEQDQQNDFVVQKISEALQVCLRRIQWKKQKFQELKEQVIQKNLKINFFEKDEDGEYQRRSRNYRIKKGKTRKYECKICKKNNHNYQQVREKVKKGYSNILYSDISFFEKKPREM